MKRIILIISLILPLSLLAKENTYDEYDSEFYEQTESSYNPNKETSITFANSKLTIENAKINSIVEVFSLVGNKIFKGVMTETKQFFIVDLQKGYYFVKVGNATRKISVQ